MLPATMVWLESEKALRLLDQRFLPQEVCFVDCASCGQVAEAIKNMTVRGAPAIGVAAAYGLVLAAKNGEDFERACERMSATRPTAVDLFWAVGRMKKAAQNCHDKNCLYNWLLAEAKKMQAEDLEKNKRIGRFGQALLPDHATVITHCNAGALATTGYGTALGVFRAAAENGKELKIYADETRPRLQGARLTAFELSEDGFDVTVIGDSMAAFLMSRVKIDAVVTGADRIAANGDTANKIGTYGLAIAAQKHGVPFYVAAPLSTVDAACTDGSAIPIEERSGGEVRSFGCERILPDSIKVWNPSFDVTPAGLITGIITDAGVFRAPYDFKNKI